MSRDETDRAYRIRIDRENAPSETWKRGKDADDQLWWDQTTPGRGSITSPALVDRITDAIEASK